MEASIETVYDEGRRPVHRMYARVKLGPSDQPQQFGVVLKVVEALRTAGVPSDAYVMLTYPECYAQWERDVR